MVSKVGRKANASGARANPALRGRLPPNRASGAVSDHAPSEARGLLPLSMNLRHHPTVATAIIDVGRRLFQRHGGGGGNQTDHHLVKLGNENVRGLGEQ